MVWWAYTLFALYALACVILIIVVLLQPGKADAAALFGGGASQTAFGPRGTQNFLGYVTIVSAIIFMGVGLLFSFPGVIGPSSVVRGVSDTAPAIPPAQPPITPLAEPAKAAPEIPASTPEPAKATATLTRDQGAAKKAAEQPKPKATEPAKPTDAKP